MSETELAPMWQPSEALRQSSNTGRFLAWLEEARGKRLADYWALHAWSVEDLTGFWDAVWDFCRVIGERNGSPVIVDENRMPGAKFFPEARINYAENLLRRSDQQEALVFVGENGLTRRFTWTELNALVSRLQQALEAEGVGPGDRVAAFLPNMAETVAAMLATVSLGAVWSSCSPDFGTQGVVDRFGQIEPKVLFCCDGYHYAGKRIATLERVADIAGQIPSIGRIVVVPYLDEEPDASELPNGARLADFLAPFEAAPPRFTRMPFNSPLYILFSSGTTGKPKCIVHGAGGVLLKHLVEHVFQCDVRQDDRVFYFTTCGWMMWNWLVSGLACGATLVLFDGSPFHPDGNRLFDLAEAERITLFGTSAKYLDAVGKAEGVEPIKTHDLSSVRLITSTGSPLAPEGFDTVYRRIKSDVPLASIAGGTDIVGCFVGGCPLLPVWRGEIQAPMLGMAVETFDEAGRSVRGEKGELVCTRPFPSMPLGFWDDPGDERYRAAYFERFPNVWHHGDYVMITEHGGIVIYGRSDATLNPGGVRIGTAEIYRQVETLEEVQEAIVVGQDWEGDVRVVLFVRLKPGHGLNDDLVKRIRTRIRSGASPRHVPAKVLEVTDIPRTKSGKIVELAVRDVIHGRPIKNVEALANPEALDQYRNLPELAS